MKCPDTYINFYSYHPQIVAGSLSAFSGILAGFSFAAIVLLVGDGKRRENRHGPIRAFCTSLVLLVLSSFLYGQVSGEVATGTRALTTNCLAGFTVAAGTFALFYGVVRLLAGVEPKSAAYMARMTVAITVPITALFLSLAVLDLVGHIRCQNSALTGQFWLIVVAIGALFMLLIVQQLRWDEPIILPANLVRHLEAISVPLGGVLVIIVVLLTAVVNTQSPNLYFSPWVPASLLAIATVPLAGVAWKFQQLAAEATDPTDCTTSS